MRSMTRRLLVTVGAFATAFSLSVSAVVAASPQKPTSAAPTATHHSGGCGHAYGAIRTPSGGPAVPDRGKPAAKSPTENDVETVTEDEGNRPHNHGWYVSQAAHDKSFEGRNHGQHVSEVAQSDAGKPDQSNR